MKHTIAEMIKYAFEEDLPDGDLTTDSLEKKDYPGKAKLIAKEDLVLSGLTLFEQSIKYIEPNAEVKFYFNDSDFVLKGQTVAVIEGNLIEILKAERVALNFLGHLSGIASLTKCFVQAAEGTKCKILDTRKTMPLYRALEKKAVADGGGTNHRMNLSDAILIKENHIHVAGGLGSAIQRAKSHTNSSIEIEVKSLEEVKKVLKFSVNRMMFDNMSTEEMKEALAIMPASIESEASGNMTVERVKEVSKIGVNFISVGAITHSAPNADLSLLFNWE